MKYGFTLTELIVVLAILAIVGAVTPLAVRTAMSQQDRPFRTVLAAARRKAIESRTAVRGHLDSTGRFIAFPNGVVLTDSFSVIELRQSHREQ